MPLAHPHSTLKMLFSMTLLLHQGFLVCHFLGWKRLPHFQKSVFLLRLFLDFLRAAQGPSFSNSVFFFYHINLKYLMFLS